MNKFIAAALLALALTGAAVAGYLTYRHYEVTSGRFDKPSFCSWSRAVDCDAVANSKYASVAGWPVSTFGMMFYGFMAALALVCLFSSEDLRAWLMRAMAGVSVVALLIDLTLAYILFFKIKILCVLCIATYGVSLLLVAFSCWGVLRSKTKPLGDSLMKLATVFILALVLAGSAAGADRYWKKSMQPTSMPASPEALRAQLKTWLDAQPLIPEGINLTTGPMHGNPNAKVTIIDFSDFECPHCRRAATMLRPVMATNSDKVRLFYKNYPLDRSCNVNIKRDMHQKACMFAMAALCAREQAPRDLFWEMHDIIFDKGEALSRDGVIDEAVRLGLARGPFVKCLDAESTLQRVREDVAMGDKLEVHSTPTLILNGRKLAQGVFSPEVWQVLIDLELERLK